MSTSVTANQIKTWERYYFDNKRTIPSTATALFPVDNEINRKVSLWQGDITHLRVDAIVNAAKRSLAGGGGVDGAIHRAAGRGLKAASVLLGPIRPGMAVITGGYNLPTTYVIHAVGPQNQDPSVLRSAYRCSLKFTASHALRTIAFPSISTGIYGFPPDAAARNACKVVRKFLDRNKNRIDRIIFVIFGYADKINYEIAMSEYFPIGPRFTKDDLSAALASARFPSPSASLSSILSRTSFGSGIQIPTALGRRSTSARRMSSARRSASPTSAYPARSRRRTATARRISSSITSPSSLGLLGPIPSAYSARSRRRLTSPTRIASSRRMSSVPTAYSYSARLRRRLTSPTRIASSRRMTSVRPITSTLRRTSSSSLGSLGSIRRRMMPPGSTRPRILRTMRHTLPW